MQAGSGGEAALSTTENQDGHGGVGGDLSAALGSVEAEQHESVKRVPPAAKWGMAGLLVVYTGLGAYALVSTIGSGAGPGHPEGVTRSVAIALGKPSAQTRAGSATAPAAPASGSGNLWGQLANIKSASGAAAAAGMASTPTQPAAPPDEVLTAISAAAVGPDGTSDGDHPELAPFVLGSHSAMSWVTHWYESAKFGNLQDGTGLLLDMGRTVTVRQIELALGGSPGFWGADVQIRIGDTPDLAGLPPVATASDVGGWVTADLRAPASGRYVQVWFTKLPLDQQGTFQEHVYGITVHGSAPRPTHSSASWVNNLHTTGHTTGRTWGTHHSEGHGEGHGSHGYGGYHGSGAGHGDGGHGHGGGGHGGFGGGGHGGGGHGSTAP
jgi:hypothetical protein